MIRGLGYTVACMLRSPPSSQHACSTIKHLETHLVSQGMRLRAQRIWSVVAGALCFLLLLSPHASSATVFDDASILQGVRHAPQASLRCRDGDGNAVDWWLILKAPNGTRYGYIDAVTAPSYLAAVDPCSDAAAKPRKGAAAGSGAPFADALSPDGGWRAATHLNSNRSPLSRTLQPLYPAANLTGCASDAPGACCPVPASYGTHTIRRLVIAVNSSSHAVAAACRVAHVMYNDETPQGPTSVYRGHAKGVLAFAELDNQVFSRAVPKYCCFVRCPGADGRGLT